jgi:hypothetical protein
VTVTLKSGLKLTSRLNERQSMNEPRQIDSWAIHKNGKQSTRTDNFVKWFIHILWVSTFCGGDLHGVINTIAICHFELFSWKMLRSYIEFAEIFFRIRFNDKLPVCVCACVFGAEKLATIQNDVLIIFLFSFCDIFQRSTDILYGSDEAEKMSLVQKYRVYSSPDRINAILPAVE